MSTDTLDNKPIINKGDPIVPESQNITVEKLQKFIPKGTNIKVTEDIVKIINNIENDTGLNQNYAEERVMSSLQLLGKQGVTLEKLVNAVKYCTLKRHMTNKKAWAITFPAEYDRIVARGGNIDTHVSMFNSTYLVVEIDKMMLVPFYIQYDALKHEALERQANLMRGIGANKSDYVSPHIQHLASKAVYEMLKAPEDRSIELKIGQSDAAIEQQREMSENIAKIVEMQAQMFKNGGKAKDIQKIHLVKQDDYIEAEVDDDDE